MTLIRSAISTSSPEFRENVRAMRALVADLREKVAVAAEGGGATARHKHLARGKLLPRDRIERLLDPGSPFLEIGQLAGHGLYGCEAPSGGIIAGIGRIEGRAAMILANDATVKGRHLYPITVKKHLRAQAIAAENRLPCVYLVRFRGGYCRCRTRSFPTRTISAASSTIRPTCRRQAFRRSPS